MTPFHLENAIQTASGPNFVPIVNDYRKRLARDSPTNAEKRAEFVVLRAPVA